MALLGAGGGPVYLLQPNTYTDSAISPADAGVTLNINSNGTVVVTGDNLGTLASYNWITPTTGSTTYYVRADLISGTFTSGTTGTWLALTSDRSWRIVYLSNLPGNNSATATFQIATDSAGTNVVVSAEITLEAVVGI